MIYLDHFLYNDDFYDDENVYVHMIIHDHHFFLNDVYDDDDVLFLFYDDVLRDLTLGFILNLRDFKFLLEIFLNSF
jgi:hypothetical protein